MSLQKQLVVVLAVLLVSAIIQVDGARSVQNKLPEKEVGHTCYNHGAARIINGTPVKPGQYPFQARIHKKDSDFLCGGSVIGERHILTAAHCVTWCSGSDTLPVSAFEYDLWLGDYSLNNENDGNIRVELSKVIPHENFDICKNATSVDDIALLETKEPIKFIINSDGFGSVNQILLPEKADITYQPGEQMTVIGWGLTGRAIISDILQEASVALYDYNSCRGAWANDQNISKTGHICAMSRVSGSCKGDSGGPLVRKAADGILEVVGVTSFGTLDCNLNQPGVYTRVSNYLDWIRSNIKTQTKCDKQINSSSGRFRDRKRRLNGQKFRFL